MSDLMLFGVLRMPYEMAMSCDLTRRQFYDRAQQACDELERLRAELAEQVRVTAEVLKRAERVEAELADERKRHDENLVLWKQAEAERDALRADAERAAGKTAMRCIEMAMWPQGIDDEQEYYGRMFAEFIEKEFKSAIDAAARGKESGT